MGAVQALGAAPHLLIFENTTVSCSQGIFCLLLLHYPRRFFTRRPVGRSCVFGADLIPI